MFRRSLIFVIVLAMNCLLDGAPVLEVKYLQQCCANGIVVATVPGAFLERREVLALLQQLVDGVAELDVIADRL
jgi:hypothetical protein